MLVCVPGANPQGFLAGGGEGSSGVLAGLLLCLVSLFFAML